MKSCFPCRNGPSVLSTKQMKAVYRAEPLPDQLPANKRPNIILFLTDDQARNANAIRCIAKLTGLNRPALGGSSISILEQSGDLSMIPLRPATQFFVFEKRFFLSK